MKWLLIPAVLIVLVAAAAVFVLARGLHKEPPKVAQTLAVQADSSPMPAPIAADKVEGMRAVFVATSGDAADFPSKQGLSAIEQKAEIDAMTAKLAALKLNTIILEAQSDSSALYDSSYFPSSAALTGRQGKDPGYDALQYFIGSAHRNGLKLYAYVSPGRIQQKADLAALATESPAVKNKGWTVTGEDGGLYFNLGLPAVEKMVVASVTELVKNEKPDGVVLDGSLYPAKNFDDAAAYQKYGGKLSRDEWRRVNATNLEKDICRAVKAAGKHIRFGVMADPVWLNASQNPAGSATSSAQTAYDDHFSDTRQWVKSAWLDFICPKAFGAMGDTSLPFEKVVSYWGDTVKGTGVQLYTGQAVYKTGAAEAGWSSPDQIVRQLQYLSGVSSCSGSVFFGYRQLLANTGGVMDSVTKYFANSLDATFGSELSISAPENGLVTNQGQVTISGTSDSNFPLTINGAEVARSSKGFFAQVEKLSPGSNTFTVSHKGKTVTLKVTYSIDVLSAVQPAGTVTEFGGTQINIIAVAREGASVSASVGKQKINMSATAIRPDGNAAMPTVPAGYACYMGTFTLPASTAKVQDLGKVKVSASWNGFSETMSGGDIRVAAFAQPPAGSKQIAHLKIAQGDANDLYIETYKYNDDLYRPDTYPQLPGTWDYIETNSNGSPKVYTFGDMRYYKLTNGQLLYIANADVKAQAAPAYNRIGSAAVSDYDGGRYTRFSFGFSQKITYTAGTNISYPNASFNSFGKRDYSVSSFNATTFQITFYNTDSASAARPGGFSSPLISSVDMNRLSATTVQYVFHLKHAGAFYGNYIFYDGNNFIIDFKNPWNGDYSKLRIAIDPGHCAQFTGASGFNGVNEKDVNLKYALEVRRKLVALGIPSGNIYMTREGDSFPYTPIGVNLATRAKNMINFRPDFTLCIHNNASDGTAAGVETYYFQPFSQPYVQDIQKRLVQAYQLAKTADSYPAYPNMGNDRGARFTSYNSASGTKPEAYYSVRQFQMPSTLVECGFVDNPNEFQFLWSSVGTNRITDALRDGVMDFMNAQKQYAVNVVNAPSGGESAAPSGVESSLTQAPESAASATMPIATVWGRMFALPQEWLGALALPGINF